MRWSSVLVGLALVVAWLAPRRLVVWQTATVPGSGRPRRTMRPVGVVVAALVVILVTGCTDSSAGPATVETMRATGVTESMATVEGSVSGPSEEEITYWFEFGETPDYGTETTTRSLEISDKDAHQVSAELTGLAPETTYHYRACTKEPATICGADRSFTTVTPSSITADPALYPDFDPAVSDYVTRCGPGPVTMTVTAPSATEVAIADRSARTGSFTEDVTLTPGEGVELSTTTSGRTSAFHVRCLPDDFPDWTFSRPGDPSAHFYITTPQSVATPDDQTASVYVAIFDDQGVPVWWQRADGATDAKLLPDGTLGWGVTEPAAIYNTTPAAGFDRHLLDGSLIDTWRTVGSPTDFHDFQMLENGNALMGSYPARPGTLDLTPYGGPSTGGTLVDGEVQEITPDGQKVWSWSTLDHIDPAETVERWRPTFVYGLPLTLPDGRLGFDWAHLNSVDQVGDTIVVSFRHLDAVYAIDTADGEILWKLGGTPTSKSLTVVGDPESNPLGGQHDARMSEDGTLTIYDNNSLETTPPRGVSYQIDLQARTATMVESVSDPDVTTSACCGSAAELADGSWLMSWGGTRVISEFGPTGDRHFVLTFKEKAGTFGFSYRVDAIEGESPTIDDLRVGMDAMQ